MIKPTNGRIVLYTPAQDGPKDYRGQALAAIVTHVWSDRMVNLCVFDPNGIPYSRTSVPLLQDDDVAPSAGYYAEWMPYQKGQAAKTEQALKALDENKAAIDGMHDRVAQELARRG